MQYKATFIEAREDSFTTDKGEVIRYYRVTLKHETDGLVELKCSENAYKEMIASSPKIGDVVEVGIRLRGVKARKEGQEFIEAGIVQW